MIFINHRQSQTAGEARALYDRLAQRLGASRLVMDIDGIAPGRDLRQVLNERLAGCEAMLAVIGPGWLAAVGDDADDVVRIEIAVALKRGIPVVPVLVQGASMPPAADLPEELKGLSPRNGFVSSPPCWESDVDELLRRLNLAPAPGSAPASTCGVPASPPAGALAPRGPSPRTVPPPAPRRAVLRIAAAGVGTLAMAAAAGWLMSRGMPADDESEAATVTTLLARADDADEAVRRAAVESLRRDHGRSPVAVEMTVEQLWLAGFAGLSTPGRIGRLDFLLASDDGAWTARAHERAADALRGLHAAAAAGRLALEPAVADRLSRLGKRLGS